MAEPLLSIIDTPDGAAAVFTKTPSLLFFLSAHTSIIPTVDGVMQGAAGIMIWWNTKDRSKLAMAHEAMVKNISKVGYAKIREACAVRAVDFTRGSLLLLPLLPPEIGGILKNIAQCP